MAVGKGTNSGEDSYNEKEKPKRRIINYQIVYESSWVNE